MARSVLLITHSQDDPADLVARAVRARDFVPVRLDTDRFPTEATLELEQGDGPPRFTLRDRELSTDLGAVEAVWYRRFYGAALPDTLEPQHARYSKQEARTLLASLFAALPAARWVDPIARVHRAHHKLLQLEVAKRVGLRVPATLATNDPAAARRFFDHHRGQVVTKMLNSISLRDDGGGEQMVFTSQVREEDFAEIEGLRLCPAVFQERVPKEVELRVAVVGDQLFVASIDASGSQLGEVDWRRDGQLARQFRPDRLPALVADAVRALMRAYGLVYGSIDLIRRPDGEHVFLEINSAGEWAWLATVVGLPIHEALADVLTGRVEVDRKVALV